MNHHSNNPILEFFKYDHLRPEYQGMSKEFFDLVQECDERIPNNAEKSAGFRKLLEAKDCMVRAIIQGESSGAPFHNKQNLVANVP